jgi:hypothetical protein
VEKLRPVHSEGILARIRESTNHYVLTEHLEGKKVSCAGVARIASSHRIVCHCSFILGHYGAAATPSSADSSQAGGYPCSGHSAEGGGGTAGRAPRATGPRRAPGLRATHCGGAAGPAGRHGMQRVAVRVEERAWGGRREGTDGACVVGGEEGEGEGGLRIDEKEQEDVVGTAPPPTVYRESAGRFR